MDGSRQCPLPQLLFKACYLSFSSTPANFDDDADDGDDSGDGVDADTFAAADDDDDDDDDGDDVVVVANRLLEY